MPPTSVSWLIWRAPVELEWGQRAEGATGHGGLRMTAGTERSLGMAIAILGVVVLVVAVVVLNGTEAWLLASSAVLFLVCGAGLLANARSRLRREHDA
jgi:Flp pilus assembly protein TadB